MIYSDVGPEHDLYPYILWARRLLLMQGYPDRTFRPDQPITRAEAATVAVRTVLVSFGLSATAVAAALLIGYALRKKEATP